MVFFQWKDEFETGLPHIDLQHTMIVNMINELHAAMQAEGPGMTAEKTLDKLLQYVEDHFTTEERAMRDNAYPGLPAHVAEHDAFRSRVRARHDRHRQGDPVASQELIELLREWLQTHIAEVDTAFGRYVFALSEEARKAFFSGGDQA